MRFVQYDTIMSEDFILLRLEVHSKQNVLNRGLKSSALAKLFCVINKVVSIITGAQQ